MLQEQLLPIGMVCGNAGLCFVAGRAECFNSVHRAEMFPGLCLASRGTAAGKDCLAIVHANILSPGTLMLKDQRMKLLKISNCREC
jgi:hypothetical protein